MKKYYNAPQINVVEIKADTLLAASTLPVGGDGRPKKMMMDQSDDIDFDY